MALSFPLQLCNLEAGHVEYMAGPGLSSKFLDEVHAEMAKYLAKNLWVDSFTLSSSFLEIRSRGQRSVMVLTVAGLLKHLDGSRYNTVSGWLKEFSASFCRCARPVKCLYGLWGWWADDAMSALLWKRARLLAGTLVGGQVGLLPLIWQVSSYRIASTAFVSL